MTSYQTIFDRFSNKITDFNLAQMDDYTLKEMLKDWLHTAMVKVRTSSDLSKYDDDEEVFEADLTNTDIELLAIGMSLCWLDQQLNSTELTSQFVGGKEEKYYSQANHIAALQERRNEIVREMHRIYTYNTYSNNKYFK